MVVAAAIVAIFLWSVLHNAVVRPFVLTGVVRNFMEAGIKDMPTEADFDKLESMSPKFAKLRNRS